MNQGGRKMNNDTRKLVDIAVLSAIAVVLYMFEIPVFPPLKIDLSDLPVLVGTYAMGAGSGILIAFLKNLVHAFTISENPSIIGELANFGYGVFVLLPILHYRKTNKIASLIGGVFFTAILMHCFNAWVTFPLYGMPSENKHQILLKVFLPVNIIKAGVLYLVFTLIKPYLDRRNR